MSTYFLTKYHFNLIKDRVPHNTPKFFKDCGIDCVEVEMQDDIFTAVTTQLGWI